MIISLQGVISRNPSSFWLADKFSTSAWRCTSGINYRRQNFIILNMKIKSGILNELHSISTCMVHARRALPRNFSGVFEMVKYLCLGLSQIYLIVESGNRAWNWLHVISCDVSKLFALNCVFLLVSPLLDCHDSWFVFCCFVSSSSNIHQVQCSTVLLTKRPEMRQAWRHGLPNVKKQWAYWLPYLNFRACFMTSKGSTIYSSSAKTIVVSELKSTLRDSSHLSDQMWKYSE